MFIVAGAISNTKTVRVYAEQDYPGCGWLASKGMTEPPGVYEFGSFTIVVSEE